MTFWAKYMEVAGMKILPDPFHVLLSQLMLALIIDLAPWNKLVKSGNQQGLKDWHFSICQNYLTKIRESLKIFKILTGSTLLISLQSRVRNCWHGWGGDLALNRPL